MKRIVGSNSVLLKDANKIRAELRKTAVENIYDWMDNSSIQNQLSKMADKEYKLNGCEQALSIIENMDTEQLRKYLRERIQDDSAFGLQILKGE